MTTILALLVLLAWGIHHLTRTRTRKQMNDRAIDKALAAGRRRHRRLEKRLTKAAR